MKEVWRHFVVTGPVMVMWGFIIQFPPPLCVLEMTIY